METDRTKSATDRMKDKMKLPPNSELANAVKLTNAVVGDVKHTVKSTESAKIAQGDEGRSANGE